MALNLFDDRPERLRTKMSAMAGLLAVANGGAWAWALAAFHDRPLLLAAAALAYMLGLRHAFDADHIAAIDNTVRKLMQDGKAPFSAGFFFSLGHSSVVMLATLGISLTAGAWFRHVEEVRAVGGFIGAAVSAVFLLVVGFVNLVVLRDLVQAWSRAKLGQEPADAGELMLSGPFARFFRPLFKTISRSWGLFPIGFLFGLGFDTATEIGLLAIAASQVTQGEAVLTVLVFPALFAAGMSLMDTVDSAMMTRVYRWAFVDPVRKLRYNIAITAASVAAALFIGLLQAGALIARGMESGPWAALAGLSERVAGLGLAVAALFVLAWVVSVLRYRMSVRSEPVAR
ncbi:MAG: HoxN/HupN/NixA family nickel/cobalt transporter [Hyphomonadaceae bacterium]